MLAWSECSRHDVADVCAVCVCVSVCALYSLSLGKLAGIRNDTSHDNHRRIPLYHVSVRVNWKEGRNDSTTTDKQCGLYTPLVPECALIRIHTLGHSYYTRSPEKAQFLPFTRL